MAVQREREGGQPVHFTWCPAYRKKLSLRARVEPLLGSSKAAQTFRKSNVDVAVMGEPYSNYDSVTRMKDSSVDFS